MLIDLPLLSSSGTKAKGKEVSGSIEEYRESVRGSQLGGQGNFGVKAKV